MKPSNSVQRHSTRLRPLAACLALALSGDIFAGARANDQMSAQAHLLTAYDIRPYQYSPDHPNAPQTRIVQNCSDHDPDSLRDIIENTGE